MPGDQAAGKGGILTPENACLVIVDVQERLWPVISDKERVAEKCATLLQGAALLRVPAIVTEQYPKGLGPTIPTVAEHLGDAAVIEKTAFSCWGEEAFRTKLQETGRREIILAGMETHVCVLQTVLDLLAAGRSVHLVADAVGSRNLRDYEVALRRMEQAGALPATTEMVLFQLLRDARAPEFKAVQKLIK
jgi:nicotinamidase-related amidase